MRLPKQLPPLQLEAAVQAATQALANNVPVGFGTRSTSINTSPFAPTPPERSTKKSSRRAADVTEKSQKVAPQRRWRSATFDGDSCFRETSKGPSSRKVDLDDLVHRLHKDPEVGNIEAAQRRPTKGARRRRKIMDERAAHRLYYGPVEKQKEAYEAQMTHLQARPPSRQLRPKESTAMVDRLYTESLQKSAEKKERLWSNYVVDPPRARLTREQQEASNVRLYDECKAKEQETLARLQDAYLAPTKEYPKLDETQVGKMVERLYPGSG